MHHRMITPDAAIRIGGSELQGLQERHQVFVLLPRARRPLLADFTERYGNGFQRQVDLRINVGRADRLMSQPVADGVDVHPGKNKMTGRRMSDHVRRDRSAQECWNLRSAR